MTEFSTLMRCLSAITCAVTAALCLLLLCMASRLCECALPQLRPFVAFNEEREPADVLDSDVRASLREVVSPTTTTLCVSTAKLLATTHTHTHSSRLARPDSPSTAATFKK